jgi:hypothetical protein
VQSRSKHNHFDLNILTEITIILRLKYGSA